MHALILLGRLSSALAVSLAAAPPGLTPTPIPAGCPWHELSQYGLPNVNWCEDTLCTVVNEPVNAYSNVAFLVMALGMWLLGRSVKASALRRFAPAAVLVGVSSFVYHASNVYVTQVFDFLGMFVFCYLLLLINVERLGWLGSRAVQRVLPVCIIGSTVLTAAVAPLGFPIQSFIATLILGIVVTEALLRHRAVYSMRYFFLSLVVLTAGAVCSGLDVSRRLCDPHSLLQGHAVWHVLSATSLLFSFLHYRQFDRELSAP